MRYVCRRRADELAFFDAVTSLETRAFSFRLQFFDISRIFPSFLLSLSLGTIFASFNRVCISTREKRFLELKETFFFSRQDRLSSPRSEEKYLSRFARVKER